MTTGSSMLAIIFIGPPQALQILSQNRAHQALNGKTPESVSSEAQTQFALIDHYSSRSHCNGPFKTQIAA